MIKTGSRSSIWLLGFYFCVLGLNHLKCIGVTESEEALFSSPVTMHGVIQEGRTSYLQVFADTTVTLKPTPTPVRAKKQKSATDLGCTPLIQTSTSRVTSTVTSHTASQPVTDNVVQPQASGIQTWAVPRDTLQQSTESTDR